MSKVLLMALAVIAFAMQPLAGRASDLGSYVGYTIIAKKTVKGWISKDGDKKGDSFEGCDYDRIILFDDNTYLVCATYGYSYSYRPDAVILERGGSFIMVVENAAYEMRQR